MTIFTDNSTEVQLEYVLLDGENPCKRKCIKGAAPMVCRYTFEVEWYETLTKACYDCPIMADDCFKPDCVPADGYRRPILVVNRKMPGPSIEVSRILLLKNAFIWLLFWPPGLRGRSSNSGRRQRAYKRDNDDPLARPTPERLPLHGWCPLCVPVSDYARFNVQVRLQGRESRNPLLALPQRWVT